MKLIGDTSPLENQTIMIFNKTLMIDQIVLHVN